jgi:O-antigen ligase
VAAYGGLRGRARVLLGVGALAAAAAVVLTLSRAAWVTLLLGAVVVVLVAGRSRRVALPLVVAGAAAMALHPGVRARLRLLGTAEASDDRRNIWRVCRAVVHDFPLTGVGWGNLPRRSIPYSDRLAPWNTLRAWCHDSFLTAWAEGGPLLFAAVAAFWVLLLRAFWRWRSGDALARAASAGALAALLAMAANSLFHDIFYSSEAVFGLGFALAIAAALARGGGDRALSTGRVTP